MEILRQLEAKLGVSGIVPPVPGATNAPLEVPVVDPGPVAEPVPGAEQPLPPTFPAVAEPEAANAFSNVTPPP